MDQKETMNNLLEINDLTISYNREFTAVKNVSLNIGQKEIIGIVGESGSGKTTLIRCLVNLLPKTAMITSGSLTFKGKNLADFNTEQWRNLRGNDIALIFQNPGSYLNPTKKVGKQIVESIRVHRALNRKEAKEKAIKTLEKMHLKDPRRIMNTYPFQLSGGMQQRVAIAMAMAMEPPLILADEPTSALDVKTQSQIIHEMAELKRIYDTSIIIVTHNISCVANLADKIMVMHQGNVVEFGETSTVLSNPQDLYTRKLLSAIPRLNRDEPFICESA
jgi:peptide/nickel transport system ATP-binding protein